MHDPSLRGIKISRRAERDLRRLDGEDRRRARGGLEAIAAGTANADVKALAGRSPWLRLRVGQLRVLYRPVVTDDAPEGWLIARVVHRGELDRAVASLDR